MFSKFNKRNTVRDDIDTANMDFAKLDKFCGKTINVDGYFFMTGKYGKQVVIVGNGYLINMPARAVEQFEQINADDDLVHAILDGHLKIGNIKKITAKNGDTCAYDLIDA